MKRLTELTTPYLLLDPAKMDCNIARLQERLLRLGVELNPHLKTAKCIEIARKLVPPEGTCTVSTLAEAQYFANAGLNRMIYAVGISPPKLQRVLALIARGVDISVIVDSVEQAQAVRAAGKAVGSSIPAYIEVDSDGHRSGVSPDDGTLLIDIARALQNGAQLRGVLTHAGESYHAKGVGALEAIAEQERGGAVEAAEAIRDAGFACPRVSVGSTPTAFFARDLTGVTDVRAGVFVFFDLVMAGIGVCAIDDIALSVAATVIGHQRARGRIIIDAGWMSLSRDRGTATQEIDQGYGVVCDADGRPFEDLIVADTNQEHGIVAVRPGSHAPLPDIPVGSLLRILPNHACATAAQHERYHVIGARSNIISVWERVRGW